MSIRTYGREVVIVVVVTWEKGVGDNIAEEQQAQVGEAHDASIKSCSSILLRLLYKINYLRILLLLWKLLNKCSSSFCFLFEKSIHFLILYVIFF